jgi:thiol-disulfide isomerase/thioredoxin
VVILDFWTYGCINCIHVAEELRRLEDRFGPRLVVIGVHSPKFDHERNLEALRSTIVRLDRRHPIVSDPDWSLMEHYGIRAWPTLAVFAPDGKILQIFGSGDPGQRDGPREEAQFRAPQGLAFTDDALLVADAGNHQVRSLDLKSGEVRTLAGTGRVGRSRQDGEQDALHVDLRSPWDLAVRDGQAYIAMAGSHQLWRLGLGSGKIAVYAGSGREGVETGPLREASFSQPSGLALMGEDLYVADAEASAIRRVRLDRGLVENPVGTGLFDFGDRDGPLDQAQLQHVSGIGALDSDRLAIADTYNHRVKVLDLQAGTLTTVLGTGSPGSRLAGRADTQLNEPSGVAFIDGRLLVADTNNHRILSWRLESDRVEEWRLRD